MGHRHGSGSVSFPPSTLRGTVPYSTSRPVERVYIGGMNLVEWSLRRASSRHFVIFWRANFFLVGG